MFSALTLSFCCMLMLIVLFLLTVFFLFNAFILYVVSTLLNLGKKDFKTATYTVISLYLATIIVNLISTPLRMLFNNFIAYLLISFIFVVLGFLLSVYIVKQFYETTWSKAVSAYILAVAATTITGLIIGALVGLTALSLIGSSMNALMSGMPF